MAMIILLSSNDNDDDVWCSQTSISAGVKEDDKYEDRKGSGGGTHPKPSQLG